MGRANSGGYYDDAEPTPEGSQYSRETHKQSRIRQLRGELQKLDMTLKHPGLIDLDVESVADALKRKKGIEYIIEETERRCREVEESRQRAAEERERRLSLLRAAVESDRALRREVERRNHEDDWNRTWHKSPKHHGPLPGGFDDWLRHSL